MRRGARGAGSARGTRPITPARLQHRGGHRPDDHVRRSLPDDEPFDALGMADDVSARFAVISRFAAGRFHRQPQRWVALDHARRRRLRIVSGGRRVVDRRIRSDVDVEQIGYLIVRQPHFRSIGLAPVQVGIGVVVVDAATDRVRAVQHADQRPRARVEGVARVDEREFLAVGDELLMPHGLQQGVDVLDHIGDGPRRHLNAQSDETARVAAFHGRTQRDAADRHVTHRLHAAGRATGGAAGVGDAADLLEQTELAVLLLLPQVGFAPLHERRKRTRRAPGGLARRRAAGARSA